MDVRCEKCLTEYEFDDAKVTEAGVTVKCTTCGHVFKVRRAASAAPSAPRDEFSPESAQIDRMREWKIRQPAGNIFTCRELTTLQKWIVERKVSREDEISLTGDSWKRLGDIPELAGFFIVVDQANKAQLLEHQLKSGPASGPTLLSQPTMPPQKRPTSGGYQLGAPPPGSSEPTWLKPPPEEDNLEDDLKAIKRRGPGGWVAVLALLAAAGGGAYFYLRSQGMFGGGGSAPGTSGTSTAPAPTPVAIAEADSGSGQPLVVDAGAPIVDARSPDAGAAIVDAGQIVDAGPAIVDAGPRVVDAGPSVVDAGPAPILAPNLREPAPARQPKSFEGLMAQGALMERREKFSAALSAYNQAIELEPGSAEAWAGKGLVLTDMSQYGEAEAAFRQALKISPRFSDAEYGLAEALRFQGKSADAIKQYKKFLEDHPDDDNAVAAKNAISKLSD